MDSILAQEIDEQGSTIRGHDTQKAKKEENKMKPLYLMNLANIKGNTRANEKWAGISLNMKSFCYIYKHEVQQLRLEMLPQISYITADIDNIPIHIKKAQSVICSFLERESLFMIASNWIWGLEAYYWLHSISWHPQ